MKPDNKRKHKKPDLERNCYNCDHCQYICEGDYICDFNQDIVIADWEPTGNFNSCKGRKFKPI